MLMVKYNLNFGWVESRAEVTGQEQWKWLMKVIKNSVFRTKVLQDSVFQNNYA